MRRFLLLAAILLSGCNDGPPPAPPRIIRESDICAWAETPFGEGVLKSEEFCIKLTIWTYLNTKGYGGN